MKIGIVSAHYMPEAGYQEVHLSTALARMGHQVKVFTSTASIKLGGNISHLKYKAGIEKNQKYGFDILRLPATSVRAKAYARGLQQAVADFKPEVLIVLGVAKIFPVSILNDKLKGHCKIVSIYGDATEYYEWKTWGQKIKSLLEIIGHQTIKKQLYKKALACSDKIILNYPETDRIFQKFLSPAEKEEFERKKVFLNLGYDPDEYYFDENTRQRVRKNLGIADDEVAIITSTRISLRKNLEQIIGYVSDLNKEGKKAKYILVGFLGDLYEKELKDFIAKQPYPGNFICFPFLGAEAKRELYCAADVAIWQRVSISTQEAMGTGLPIILENKLSMSHLIKDNHSGWFFDPGKLDATLRKVVDTLSERKLNREQLALENAAKFSYNNVAAKILETLNDKK